MLTHFTNKNANNTEKRFERIFWYRVQLNKRSEHSRTSRSVLPSSAIFICRTVNISIQMHINNFVVNFRIHREALGCFIIKIWKECLIGYLNAPISNWNISRVKNKI